jgi:hypothetical protein
MPGGVHILKTIQVRMQVMQGHAARIRQKSLQFRIIQAIGGSIQLDAIAGGEDDQFCKGGLDPPTEQTGKRSSDLFFIESKSFAQMNRRRGMVESD